MNDVKPIKLGFLASYRGTNMQAIIDACKTGKLSAQAVVVISNNGDSGALERAASENIPGYHLSSRHFPDPVMLDQRIAEILKKHDVELVILAGYMKKIGPHTLAAFNGRILNIHPALLPKYGGQGMYGRHVHEAVIAAGDRETGVTIHVVDDKYDHGPVLAQQRVAVEQGDTAETLSSRVLAIEHEFYVATLRRIITGEISLP